MKRASLLAWVGLALVGVLLLSLASRRERGGAAQAATRPESVDRPPPREGGEELARAVAAPGEQEIVGSTSVASASARGDRVLVRTLDRNGARVREVELFETSDVGTRRIGSSGAEGELELEFPRRAWTALVARRADLGSARVSWRDTAPPLVEVRLGESGALDGRLMFPDGVAAPADMTVVAVPTRLNRWALGLELERLTSNPEFGQARSGADGAFRIEGLNRGERYALHCGGRGCVALEGQPFVEPGEKDVEILVARCYGIVLEFVDVSGAPSCVPEVYGVRGGFQMSIHDSSAEFVLNLPPSARLALGPIDALLPTPTRQIILLSSPRDLSELGPIEYSCSLPGYAEVQAECYALPIDNGLARREQPILREASDFGALVLRAEHPDTLLQRSVGRHGPVATLELTAPGAGGASVRVLRPDREEPWLFECVPFGRHELVFVSQPETEYSRMPLGMVTIGPEPVQVELPARQLGALRLGVRLEDGREYVGELVVGLGSNANAASPTGAPIVGATTVFRHAPYEFELLPQGEYRVWVSEPGVGSAPVDVRVAPGATEAVELLIRL